MRLAIGIITANEFPAPTAFWDSYEVVTTRCYNGDVNAALPDDLKIGGFERIKSRLFPTDVARNEICEAVRKGTHDYLLFLDADMVHPPDLIERLLVHRKPVVTARYHMRKPPYAPVAYVKHPTLEGPHCYKSVHYARGLVEIERCGAGALLIRRDVLLAIHDRVGPNWFRYQREAEGIQDFRVSEDFWFCRQAREAGFSVWLDWETECGHLAQATVTKEFHDAYMQRYLGDLSTMPPDKRRSEARNLVVLGFDEELTLETGERIPAYQVTAGER